MCTTEPRKERERKGGWQKVKIQNGESSKWADNAGKETRLSRIHRTERSWADLKERKYLAVYEAEGWQGKEAGRDSELSLGLTMRVLGGGQERRLAKWEKKRCQCFITQEEHGLTGRVVLGGV